MKDSSLGSIRSVRPPDNNNLISSQQPADTTEYPVSEVVVKKKWMKLSEIKMCTLRKPEPLQFAEYISQG